MNAKHQWKYTSEETFDDISPVDITFDVPGEVTLTQMLYNFESYLKACGFVFDGRLEIVPDEVYGDHIDDTDYCCMGDSDTCNPEVEKNNWVQGMCNPPSPDYKKEVECCKPSGKKYSSVTEMLEDYNNPDNCWNS